MPPGGLFLAAHSAHIANMGASGRGRLRSYFFRDLPSRFEE